MATKVPLWLDCDPGHDDAFAILLSAYHPNLDLLGISTVAGNTSRDQCTSNALSILEAIGRPDIPVYSTGAAKPFCRPSQHAPNIHGQNGLGLDEGKELLPQPLRKPVTQCNVILEMRQAILACEPNASWIVATGPLTNIALLFAIFPELVAHIKGLSVMGGAIGSEFTAVPVGPPFHDDEGKLQPRIGNHTPYAEFNIFCDPEAAQSIFSNQKLAGKTTLIPLDVTHQAFATKSVQNALLQGPSTTGDPTQLRKLYHALLMFFAKTYEDVFSLYEGPPVHDPLAVAVLLQDCPDEKARVKFQTQPIEKFRVEVVCDGSELGRTRVTKVATQEGVSIPRSLNVAKFWQVVNNCMEIADSHIAYARLQVRI